MKPSLYTIYTNVISTLQSERDSISDDDFENQSMKLAAFVILMHSSMEFFLLRIFAKILEVKLKEFPDVIVKITNNLLNEKIELDVYISVFLPDFYEKFCKKSAIWGELKKQRNLCAHDRIFNKLNGQFILQEKPIIKEEIENFYNYIKNTMKELLDTLENAN
jgi:hypothetical protein